MATRSLVFALTLSATLGCSESWAAPPELDVQPQRSSTPTPLEIEIEMPTLALGERAPIEAEDPVAPLFGLGPIPPHTPGELPRWIEHPTLARETIEVLALRYGVPASQIRKWNDMAEDEQPHPWRPKPLRIRAHEYPPPRVPLDYTAVEGDSWSAIARRHGVHDRHLRAWNVNEVGRSLEPGEQIVVWVDPIIYGAIVADEPETERAALVRAGAHGIGVPQAGELVVGVQLPPGPGYRLRYPNSAYGTTFAVRQTIDALDRFVAASDHPYPLNVGTMSRMRGGEIGHHLSHQTGRDLDVRLPLRPEIPPALSPTLRRVDWDVTWDLVTAFAETQSVEMIFLDRQCQRRLYRTAEARGVDEATLEHIRGLVRHSPGHEGHIHVRFGCGPAEPECADL